MPDNTDGVYSVEFAVDAAEGAVVAADGIVAVVCDSKGCKTVSPTLVSTDYIDPVLASDIQPGIDSPEPLQSSTPMISPSQRPNDADAVATSLSGVSITVIVLIAAGIAALAAGGVILWRRPWRADPDDEPDGESIIPADVEMPARPPVHLSPEQEAPYRPPVRPTPHHIA